MSASLKILVPEATVNFIENPAIRYDTTGWNASGATLSRTLEQARFGISSLKLVTPGTNKVEGAYYRVNYLSGTNDVVTVSAYVRGEGHIQVRLYDADASKQWTSKTEPLRDDRWTRIFVTGRCSGGNDIRLYVETYGNNAQAVVFYVDGSQMEIKPWATSYCDGSQSGCRWDGLDNGSLSIRNIFSRDGGKWVEVVGDDPSLENIYATATTGFGFGKIVNNLYDNTVFPGGVINNIKNDERILSIVFHAKNKDLSRRKELDISMRRLFDLRQMLIDIIKPDAVGGNQPFWIEYQDGDIPLRGKVYYDGGLEGDWDIRNYWILDFPLRLLATSPMFYEDNQQTAEFDFSDTSIFSGVAGRLDGEWKTLNGGIWNNYDPVDVPDDFVDGTIKDMALGIRGEIFTVGRFKIINYNGILDPNAASDCAAYWDGYKWIAF